MNTLAFRTAIIARPDLSGLFSHTSDAIIAVLIRIIGKIRG